MSYTNKAVTEFFHDVKISAGSDSDMYGIGDLSVKNITGITGFIETPTFIDFDTVTVKPSHQEGRVFYDITDKTLSYYNEESTITMNIGQEIWIRAYNNSGSTITDGKVCYVSGS